MAQRRMGGGQGRSFSSTKKKKPTMSKSTTRRKDKLSKKISY